MTPFQEIKASRAQVFSGLRDQMQPAYGMYRQNRLKKAGGKASKTLLQPSVAESHAARLESRFQNAFGRLTNAEANDRLRFLTVLHGAVIMDKAMIDRSVTDMEKALIRAIRKNDNTNGVKVIGAIEIELINMDLLREIEQQTKKEKRKLAVVESLAVGPNPTLWTDRTLASRYALVHFHGIADMGPAPDASKRADNLAKALRQRWTAPYAIELKKTFEKQSINKKLYHIANYLTKSGNEELRFKTSYGRELDSDLYSKIWRIGGHDPDHMPSDRRGINYGEIRFLADITYDLMRRRSSKTDGYLISISPRGPVKTAKSPSKLVLAGPDCTALF
jgi:hypothetical protein